MLNFLRVREQVGEWVIAHPDIAGQFQGLGQADSILIPLRRKTKLNIIVMLYIVLLYNLEIQRIPKSRTFLQHWMNDLSVLHEFQIT